MNKKLICKNCGRYFGMAHGTVITTLKCYNSKCKDLDETEIKIVTNDRAEDLRFKFVDQKPADNIDK